MSKPEMLEESKSWDSNMGLAGSLRKEEKGGRRRKKAGVFRRKLLTPARLLLLLRLHVGDVVLQHLLAVSGDSWRNDEHDDGERLLSLPGGHVGHRIALPLHAMDHEGIALPEIEDALKTKHGLAELPAQHGEGVHDADAVKGPVILHGYGLIAGMGGQRLGGDAGLLHRGHAGGQLVVLSPGVNPLHNGAQILGGVKDLKGHEGIHGSLARRGFEDQGVRIEVVRGNPQRLDFLRGDAVALGDNDLVGESDLLYGFVVFGELGLAVHPVQNGNGARKGIVVFNVDVVKEQIDNGSGIRNAGGLDDHPVHLQLAVVPHLDEIVEHIHQAVLK